MATCGFIPVVRNRFTRSSAKERKLVALEVLKSIVSSKPSQPYLPMPSAQRGHEKAICLTLMLRWGPSTGSNDDTERQNGT